MNRVFGSFLASVVLVTASCGGDSSAPTNGAETLTVEAVASGLVDSANGDEAGAITGLLIAADRGYRLATIAEAAQAGRFNTEAGAITDGDNVVAPSGTAGGFITDAPQLSSVGAIAASGWSTDESAGDVGNIVQGFLDTPVEQLLIGLDPSDTAPAPAKPPPDPSAFDYLRTVVVLALIDGGYSPEQVVEAIVFGEKFRCEASISVTCVLTDSEPALAPQGVFESAGATGETSGDETSGGEGDTWTGSLVYDDDTVPFEMGTSEVTVVRDFDGEFSITALLTYTTTPESGTCSFSWEKTYAGTGELDASGTSIAFDGTETVKNTSSCPDANTVDRSENAQRVIRVDGNTLSGVVATGSFTITGPDVK